ncbi:hypothetical protein LF887_18100 [Chryseobacterium sp. MEBOG06]|uniref:hypothetical protein n=1 Tax=Chryseobacterium sp. MEBOG06 TaxID=2879938 RepID=UPI001F2227A0|nr:hypothetical protein [Chryseobacterium sp. MEBOG06]UKB82908.1 hypothetical protein LF887_18100 [Chryseobacterium sp. MEBOG06]
MQYAKKDVGFYNYMDKIIKDRKFKFLEISYVKRCGNDIIFSLSEMNYNDNLSDQYKVYDYKGTLIIYDVGDEKDKNLIGFFDAFFKKSNRDISFLPKGRQSIINATAMYFKSDKFITDKYQIQYFMEKDCETK